MQTIYEALSKARKSLQQHELGSLLKTLKYFLRPALNSIYLIKISEQKMLEVAEKQHKATE